MSDTVKITVELDRDQAWEFAQFLKRLTWDDYRRLAEDKSKAYHMQSVGEQIRVELRYQGVDPR